MANRTNYYPDGNTIYQSSDFRAPWAALLSNGTLNGYAVTADSPADLGVTVAAGIAVINGYVSRDDANISVPIAANTSGYNRIDLIVINIDEVGCATTIEAVQGVPSSSPVTPTVGSNQLALAHVLVGNNASVINSNVITDVRSKTIIQSELDTFPTLLSPAYVNGWSDVTTSSYEKVHYWKDKMNHVYIEGHMKGSSSITAFTMPFGYRPNGTITVVGKDTICYIGGDGIVLPSGGTTDFCFCCVFLAEQ